MIRASNILEPQAETAYILWRWLQDEPFQFAGRMYIAPGASGEELVLNIYWDNSNCELLNSQRRSKSISITCRGTEVRVFDIRLVENRKPWDVTSPEKVFNIADPSRFEDLLAFIKWRLPK